MINILGEHSQEMEKAAEACCELLNIEGNGLIELNYVSKDEIRDLNNRTRGIDSVTDVLSYPYLDEIIPMTEENYPFDYDKEAGGVLMGSCVICTDKAREQAAEYGHSELREMTYLFVHSMLHILGYDHMEEDDKKIMREKEEQIMNKIGVLR